MTIYDIAKEANVAASTVSRVINNKPGVGEKTRKRIQELLERYNYKPDSNATSLSRKASKLIGIVISDVSAITYVNTTYVLEKGLAEKGYDVLLFNCGSDLTSQRRCFESISSRKADATILIGASFQSHKIKKLIEKYIPNIPVASINGYIGLKNVYSIMSDDMTGTENCVEYLHGKGRISVALITDNEFNEKSNIISGFKAGIKKYYPDQQPIIYEIANPIFIHESSRYTEILLKEHPDIDAVVYSSSMNALLGIHALNNAGKAVPNDIAVIGLDNTTFAEISNPPLTVIDNKILHLCSASINILLDVMNKKSVPHKTLVLPEIIERKTT